MKKILSMYQSILPFVAFFVLSLSGRAQVQTVADLTLKIASGEDKELFYSFAAGDEIQFSFFENNNKKMKEVEVTAWPDQVRFAVYETADAREQKIAVPATGVYRFRFRNAGIIGERVCRISIKRRAASEALRLFDTGVRWEERQDTFYRKGNQEWPAYTERSEIQKRRVPMQTDTSVVNIMEKTERIFSRSGMLYGSNASEMKFRLPQNRYLPDPKNIETASETVSWAYWIGVGDEADRNYRDANLKAASKLAEAAVGLNLLSTASGYGALALLAVKGVAMFSNPPKGDNVRYNLWNDKGESLDSGNSIVTYRSMDRPLQGDFLLQLQNDNVIDGINVTVRVIAIVQTKTFREEPYIVTQRIPAPPEQRQGNVVVRKVQIPYVAGM